MRLTQRYVDVSCTNVHRMKKKLTFKPTVLLHSKFGKRSVHWAITGFMFPIHTLKKKLVLISVNIGQPFGIATHTTISSITDRGA